MAKEDDPFGILGFWPIFRGDVVKLLGEYVFLYANLYTFQKKTATYSLDHFGSMVWNNFPACVFSYETHSQKRAALIRSEKIVRSSIFLGKNPSRGFL